MGERRSGRALRVAIGVAVLAFVAWGCGDVGSIDGDGGGADVAPSAGVAGAAASADVPGAPTGNVDPVTGEPVAVPGDPAATGDAIGLPPSPDGSSAELLPGLPTDCADGATVSEGSYDEAASIAAFESSVYPVLRTNCAKCHSLEGRGQLPHHSHTDVATAHAYARSFVSMTSPDKSELIRRLSLRQHNCFGDCQQAAATMQAAIEQWAAAVAPTLPSVSLSMPEGAIEDAQVDTSVAEDLATFAPEEAQYMRYVSLHELYNEGASLDDLNLARAGVSKSLNAHARHAPAIANPEPIDCYALIYRFDIRDYWGYSRGGGFGFGGYSFGGGGGEVTEDPARALEVWARIAQGNIEADQSEEPIQGPNIDGFHETWVEARQLAYTLSRPDVYNEIMEIPSLGSMLESQLGVEAPAGNMSYQYMTVNDAITISERLMWRAPIADGYYWRSVDQFSQAPFVFYDYPVPQFTSGGFSQIKTTPLTSGAVGGSGADYTAGTAYTGEDGLQAQASEIIFSLPNGLQGYMIAGAGNQRRVDAFTFIVVDPLRGGGSPEGSPFFRQSRLRLLQSASCHSCHSSGINHAVDDMRPFLEEEGAARFDEATLSEAMVAYPGNDVMQPVLVEDRNRFLESMQQILDGVVLGPLKQVYAEPIWWLFKGAQSRYGYMDTVHN